jgi:hypothetical protein
MLKMRRREFITLLGGAAAWPLAAHSQTKRMRRIGVLMGLVVNDPEAQSRVAAFENGANGSLYTARAVLIIGPPLVRPSHAQAPAVLDHSCTLAQDD